MRVGSRSRYGLRLLFELARNYEKGPLMLREIARRQRISLKYLSTIIIGLKSEGLVLSIRGARGGYALARSPHEIDLGEIMKALGEGLSPVDSSDDSVEKGFSEPYPFNGVWDNMNRVLSEYLANITLADLVDDYNRKQMSGVLMYDI